MKARKFMTSIALTLFVALAVPVGLAAQDAATQAKKVRQRHYRLVELGTFGGPMSYINPVGNGGPSMNRRGSVVGSSMTSIPIPSDQNGYSCPFPPDEVFHAMEWSHSGVSDLGSLGDVSNCGNALGINDDGVVVGTSENGKLDPATGVLQLRAVLWKDGEIKNLGTFGGNHSLASSINNRGEIVGFALNDISDPFSLFDFRIGGSPSGTQTRAFLWHEGHMQDLQTLGGPDAWATFVNERGQVAGFSYTDSIANQTTGLPTADPFLWTKSAGMIDLGTLGGTFGFPVGLNNLGQVIGQSNLAGDQGSCDPFLWDGSNLIDLATTGVGGRFVCGFVNGINDAGEIVGAASFPNHPFDAAIWRDGVVTDLGVLPGDCFSMAIVINSRGQVAGGSFPCDFSAEHAFLWDNGTIFDLTALISPKSTSQMVEPNAINDLGEIASDGLPPGCSDFLSCSQAYVLIPCDDDHCCDGECGDQALLQLPIDSNRTASHQSPFILLEPALSPREIGARIRLRLGHHRLFELPPK